MSKKILILLFFLFVLISMSTAFAVDLDGNDNIIASSDDDAMLAVENDFNTANDFKESTADGGNTTLENNNVLSAAVSQDRKTDDYSKDVLSLQTSEVSDDVDSINNLKLSSDLNNELLTINNPDNDLLKADNTVWYVDRNSDGGDGSFDNPFTFFTEALEVSKDGDTILIAPGTYSDAPWGYDINAKIDKSLNIGNWTAGDVIFYGKANEWIFKISSSLNITGLTFKEGESKDDGGGALYVTESGTNLNLINCTFIGNYAHDYGGAIYFEKEVNNLNIINCSFIDNYADEYGGAIYFKANVGNLNIMKCKFIGNKARHSGGAISFPHYSDVETLTINITDCSFINNTAVNGDGGAISFGYSNNVETLNITDCSFLNNTAAGGNGGAIYGYSLIDSTIAGCNFTGVGNN